VPVQKKRDFIFGQNHNYNAAFNHSVKVLERLRVVRRVGGVARRRGGRVAAEAERGLDLLDRGVLQARRLEKLLQRLEVSAEVTQREVAAEERLAHRLETQTKGVPFRRVVVSRRCRRVVSRAAETKSSLDLLDRGVFETRRLEELLQRLEVSAEVAEREVAAASSSI
jgi:hypothetical protein